MSVTAPTESWTYNATEGADQGPGNTELLATHAPETKAILLGTLVGVIAYEVLCNGFNVSPGIGILGGSVVGGFFILQPQLLLNNYMAQSQGVFKASGPSFYDPSKI